MNVAITPTSTTAQTPQTTNSASVLSSDFETFLTMLTAQMKNQDPLNPIESTDYAVQLATFSNVEQQVLTNDLLKSLSTQLAGSDLENVAGWVGMEASSTSPVYFEGQPVSFRPVLEPGAEQIVVQIRSENGALMRRLEGAASTEMMSWDGLKADGTAVTPGHYTVEIESYANETLLGSNAAQSYTKITEARSGLGGVEFILSGGKTVTASQITSLRSP